MTVAGRCSSIVEVLRARSSSDALAYVFLADGTSGSEIRWTYADTAQNSAAFAARLRARNIGAGDRVVLALNPSLAYVGALYAIMQLGAIPVPCFPPLRSKELDRFQAITLDCEPKAIVIDAMYRERMTTLRSRLNSVDLDPDVIYPDDGTTQVARTAAHGLPAPSDLALIQYTSGSTGTPKGVCLTHDNLVSNCQALARSMGEDPDRIGLSWLPPYHDMGMLGTIILSMYHGWPLVLMSPMHFVQNPLRWLNAITDYRVSITVGPNFSLDMCVDALNEAPPVDLELSCVKELYCGSEPLSAATLRRFQRATAPLGFDANALIPCYGMAEATLFVAGKRAGSRYRTQRIPERSRIGRVVVSCGDVDREHAVRIVDPGTLEPLADGRIGEIWVSGRSVAHGYHNRPDLSRETFHARLAHEDTDYLRTGDLGFIESGELFVTGRIKDLIIVNGRNIYPHDVEATAVRADPAVRIAAAFAIDAGRSEQLCVLAETGDQTVTPAGHAQLVATIRASVVSDFGIRPHVQLCRKRTIPTTTSGKVRRQEARRMFLTQRRTRVWTGQDTDTGGRRAVNQSPIESGRNGYDDRE